LPFDLGIAKFEKCEGNAEDSPKKLTANLENSDVIEKILKIRARMRHDR
jgi:hypothetical protein